MDRRPLRFLKEGKKIDLILLDVMMPEMDGYEVLKRMAEQGLNKDLHVIMLTGLKASPNVMKGYDVGADYYITKPFQSEI